MEHKHDLGEFLKERLAGAEIEPSNDLWNTIESTLDNRNRGRRAFYFLLLGLALVVGTLAVFLTRYTDPFPQPDGRPATDRTPSDSLTKRIDTMNRTVRPENPLGIPSGNLAEKDHPPSENGSGSTDGNPKGKEDLEVRSTRLEEGIQGNESNGNRMKPPKSRTSEIPLTRTPREEEVKPTGPGPTDSDWDRKSVETTMDKGSKELPPESPAVTSFASSKDRKPQTESALDSIGIVSMPSGRKITETDSIPSKPEEKREKDSQRQYWVYSYFGSSNYVGLSKASAIDDRLKNYGKANGEPLGYGLHIVFSPHEKWHIRLGAAYTSLERNTFDVPIAPDGLDTNFYGAISFAGDRNYTTFSNMFDERTSLTLVETLGYLEIPVELDYRLYQAGRFGWHGLAGIAVLYNKKNELQAVTNSGQTILLGKNHGYSQASFGIHIGTGLRYRLNTNFHLHLESIVRPQIGFYETSIGDNPILLTLRLGAIYRIH